MEEPISSRLKMFTPGSATLMRWCGPLRDSMRYKFSFKYYILIFFFNSGFALIIIVCKFFRTCWVNLCWFVYPIL